MTSKAFRRTMMACLCIVLALLMYIPIIAIIWHVVQQNAVRQCSRTYLRPSGTKRSSRTSNLLPACILSLKFSFLVTLAAVVIGTLCSYGLQYYAPKWAARFNFVLQLPIIIPWLVTFDLPAADVLISRLAARHGHHVPRQPDRCAACTLCCSSTAGFRIWTGLAAGGAAPTSRGKPAARVF